jgi:hypothetical protein
LQVLIAAIVLKVVHPPAQQAERRHQQRDQTGITWWVFIGGSPRCGLVIFTKDVG